MSVSRHVAATFSLGALLLAGCSLPGRPKAGEEVPRPQAVTSFDTIYGQNCAGCHGADGQNGPATDLANPEYEALIDDASLGDVIANGEKGSLMPGFGTAAGGSLTSQQIDILVRGMRSRWSRGDTFARLNAPPYKAVQAGDPASGQQVYTGACARCHGADPGKPGPAGSILDGSFLALINAQTIRTTVIAGRPDIGQPDWRSVAPGHPLTDADVTNVTAWMLSQRHPNSGQPYPNTQPASHFPGGAQPNNVSRHP